MIYRSEVNQEFNLDRQFLSRYEGRQPEWGPLGYVVYKRTYSRVKEDGSTEEFWETCKRVVEGTYRAQKAHCTGLGLSWDDDKAQQSAQRMFEKMWDFKFLPPGRGLWMMGTKFISERGSGGINNCFSRNTKVITDEGIVPIGSLVGTSPKLLSEHGKWVEAPVRSFGKQELYKLRVRRNGIEKDIFTTKDHTWYVRDRRNAYRNKGFIPVTTEELRPGVHHLQYVIGPNALHRSSVSPIGVAHGFVFGDGTSPASKRQAARVTLCSDKDQSFLSWLSPKHSTYTNEGYPVVSGFPNYFKSLPSIGENHSYLLGWLAGYFAADGTVYKNGQVTLASAKLENLRFVKDVCAVLGIGVYSIRSETRKSNLTQRDHTMYSLCFMRDTLTEDFFVLEKHRKRFLENPLPKKRPKFWTVVSVEPTGVEEEVYCATVDKYHKFALEDNILTGNCAFVSSQEVDNDFAFPFYWAMDMLMLGVGVGFDTLGADRVTIQEPTPSDEVYVVEDTREGWAGLLRDTLNAYVGAGKLPVEIDYSKVRPKGAPIRGFGGTASGPDPLKVLIKDTREVLDKLVGKSLTSEAIVDIFDFIGRCVVAGNVRRSALLSLGSSDDPDFLDLKNPDINMDALISHRWAANNSISARVGMDYTDSSEKTALNGEPGYVWLENARAYSRMGRAPDFKDYRALGTNPCGEQTLEFAECCNLVETFPSRHESYEEFEETLKYAYLYAKSVTLIPTHSSRTNEVMMRNRRIGCSMSGIVQAMAKHGRREFFNWCDEGYDYLEYLDQKYSDWLCVPSSIKKTSVKPSGSVSLLPGVTPGIHYPHSKFYIRRVRFQEDHPIVTALKECGYHVEKDQYSPNTVVAEFPVKEDNFDRSKTQVTMWEQLENAAQMQSYWADNQVSITVTFDKEKEGPSIKSALELYETRLKSVSFLPLEDHGFAQAPYEEITEERYNEMAQKIQPERVPGLLKNITGEVHDKTEKFCTSDTCEI